MQVISLNFNELPFEFYVAVNEISNKTLISPDRLLMIYQFAKSAPKGDFAELGVYKGGSARLLSFIPGCERLWIFDTFDGMPETVESIDRHQKGDFADTSFEAMSEYLSDRKNVQIIKGLFPETVSNLETTFSFVHVDADIYSSTKAALEYFYPRLVQGGIMIFDDYYWVGCPGVNLALDEFAEQNPVNIINLTQGQAMLIKNCY